LIDQLNRMGESAAAAPGRADANLPALPEQAEALRRRGVKLYDDAVAMFRQQAGNARRLHRLQHPTHTELNRQAARCGYHVPSREAPAATVQEVDEMLAALAKAGGSARWASRRSTGTCAC